MVTSELDELYKSVLAEPYDDTIRLVYADALQEACDDSRAEFIRLQVAGRDKPRQLELLRAINYSVSSRPAGVRHYRNWECWFKFQLPNVPIGRKHQDVISDFVIQLGSWARWEYNRGFISKVFMHWDIWKHHSNELLRCEPITDIKLTSLPPVTVNSFSGGVVYGFTRMTGTITISESELSIGSYRVGPRGREFAGREMILKLLKKNWPSVKRWEIPDVA